MKYKVSQTGSNYLLIVLATVYRVLFGISKEHLSKQKSKLKSVLFSSTTHWNSNCKEGTQMEKTVSGRLAWPWINPPLSHSCTPAHLSNSPPISRLHPRISPVLSAISLSGFYLWGPLPDTSAGHHSQIFTERAQKDRGWKMGLEKALVCACVSRSHASMILKRFAIRCSEEAENIKCTIINVIHIFMVAIRWSLNHFSTSAYS